MPTGVQVPTRSAPHGVTILGATGSIGASTLDVVARHPDRYRVMGCGTWGRNNFSDNMNVRQYMNVTRVSRPLPERVPSVDDLLCAYFARWGR